MATDICCSDGKCGAAEKTLVGAVLSLIAIPIAVLVTRKYGGLMDMDIVTKIVEALVVCTAVSYVGAYTNASFLTRWMIALFVLSQMFFTLTIPTYVYVVPLFLALLWLIKKGGSVIVKTLAKIAGVVAVVYGVYVLIKNRETNVVGKTQRLLENLLSGKEE